MSAVEYRCYKTRNPMVTSLVRVIHSSGDNTSLYTIRKIKPNFSYTRDITPKLVRSGGAHLRALAPGQHSSGGEPLATVCLI